MDKSLIIYYLFLFFIIYSFLGWIIEVVFHIFTEKKLINRGFLYGPICPIYGFGGVLMIVFLEPLSENLFYLFLGGLIFATLLEYITGYILELVFDTKWWDYSDEKFNIKGYISLKFSAMWGLVAVFMINVLQPIISETVYSIPEIVLEPVYHVFLILFVVDTTLTFNSLIEFRKILKDLRLVRKEMKASIPSRAEWLKKRRESIKIRLKVHHMKLLRSYPGIESGKLQSIIDDIKKKAKTSDS